MDHQYVSLTAVRPAAATPAPEKHSSFVTQADTESRCYAAQYKYILVGHSCSSCGSNGQTPYVDTTVVWTLRD